MAEFADARQRLLDQVKSLPPGGSALETLSIVRADYDWAIPGYRKALDILSDTIYQDRKHFLLELIQNADDANYQTKNPCLTFVINADDIELQYNEEGFDVNDIIAITDTGDSKKKGIDRLTKGFIGEKGIGFKSVFALASEVEIESPPWHFLLRKDKCIVPEVLQNGKLKTGTRIRVKFTEDGYTAKIAEEIRKFVDGHTESFLFLNKLSRVIVLDQQHEKTYKSSLNIEPADRNSTTLTIREDSVTGNATREYLLFERFIEFPAELVKKRWERLASIEEVLPRKIIVAALMESAERSLTTGLLFCYLPTKITLPVPLFLQIDGHTKADRERLLEPDENEWNRHLLKAVPRFLMDAILNWRSVPSMKAGLLNYIPTSPGNDQLSDVISKWQEILKSEAWLRTLDNSIEESWISPDKALWADSYWMDWFIKEPAFRKEAEARLGKKIVNKEWINHKKWSDIRDCYNIKKLSADHVAAILRYVSLPEAMLNPSNFPVLYQYLYNIREIKESQMLKSEIKRAPIFPLGRKKWGHLLDDEAFNRKVYWLDSRSPRPTGLEDHIDYRIVDPKYTYRHEAGGKATDQRREESRQINERNDIVRNLLKILDIRELSDDRILTELQIPWLAAIHEIDERVAEIQYDVLSKIFNAYQAKQKKDDEYINLFRPLAEALFYSEKNEALRLKNLILPEALQLKHEDELYVNSSAQRICIPEKLITPPVSEAKHVNLDLEKDRLDKFRQDWRQFLIHCGIKSKPYFFNITQNFNNSYSFERSNKDLFELWRLKTNYQCIQKNAVKIVLCQLDILTLDVIKSRNYNKILMSDILYQSWKDMFAVKARTFQNNCQSSEESIPGWFKAFYSKYTYSEKTITISYTKWAGLEKDLVPLKTSNGLPTTKLKALRVLSSKKTELLMTPRYLDIVLEQDKIDEGSDYVTAYLDSLDIKKPTIAEVNALYNQFDQEHYREIAQVAIELINIGVQKFGLQLYDFKTNCFRSVSEFKRGKHSLRGCPLIEDQYGEIGKKLGEIFFLETETEISSFLGLFKEYFNNGSIEIVSRHIYEMLKGWLQFSEQQKLQIRQDIHKILTEKVCKQFIIAFNDDALMSELAKNGTPCISLNIDESDRYRFENIVIEIGLTPVTDFGDLDWHDEKSLTDEESIEFNELLVTYIESLLPRDASRLKYSLRDLGHSEAWSKRIKRVNDLQRTFYDTVKRPEVIPFLDLQDKYTFFVRMDDSTNEILAGLLSCCEFTNYKSAIRDIEDLKGNEEIGYIASCEEEASPVKIQDVVQSVKNALKELRQPSISTNGKGWKLGLPPEAEEKFRQNIIEKLEDSLIKGPDAYEKRHRSRYSNEAVPTFVDPVAPEPKTFLKTEYDGKCQICNVELISSYGDKLIETYRIVETRRKNWWANRPFNILCMCPNCHALAKHGGGKDFGNIYNHAQKILQSDMIPIEVPERQSDCYVVPVLMAGKEHKMYFSKVHLNYFAALFEHEEPPAGSVLDTRQIR